ncbi:MAG: amidohydrolase [Bacteroidales bacterium]|jgi:amidohydrolase|nr:M20 family metallopeptidase [Bacteroidales bacterium]MCK9498416.1 M20 family metallopeptidase [Bacteroidales bacterium]MDY0316025.1 M20 family metallopeptidase [Bacteroidales bacterium]NLB86269.1 amidohydrolase [Bacteroidales bacterium]
MNNIKEYIGDLSKKYFSEIVEIRRYLHQNPELSFKEFETAKFIKNILHKYNIEFDESFGENAVIGIIKGDLPGNNIALRADIDALPIQELNNCEFKSKIKGVMHACGHDAHTASLLGTAMILQKLKKYIKGNIILIFQPAEERNPGGAKLLIEKGLLKKFNISKILAQHVLPELEVGKFNFAPNFVMATSDEIYIKFSGKGGHIALANKRSDTVLALIHFVNEVNELKIKLKSDMPFIVAFGKIFAEGSINVVPETSLAEGSMRTFDENLRIQIKEKLQVIADKYADLYECKADLEIRHGYPAVYNNPELNLEITNLAKEFLGEENVGELETRMTAEDFAYYGKEVPAVFYRMGIAGNGKGITGLHNPYFDLDENVFIKSSALMAWFALSVQ